MTSPLLAGIPEEEAQRILSIARRRTFGKGDIVFHREDPADTVHLIVKGRFAVEVVTPLGDTAIVAVLQRDETFGELALVSGDLVRTATVVALEPAETRSIHRTDFEGLLQRHPEMHRVVVAILTAQVERLTERLVEALYTPADKRVLRRVAELAKIYPDGEIPLRQDDIAALAGASRATTNRVLREAEERGSIALTRGRTTVLDAEALARRAR
jgi:CRP/FNR family transcriptional regulator, cyclic AMP receptor protein